jgi:uroporphyrinogen decarboxylase
MVGWLYGLEPMIFAAYDRPEFLRALLDMIAQWNRHRMEVVLDAGVDLYIKRTWYENCDFWSPKGFRNFLLPILKADAQLAHEKGVAFGCLLTTNCMALLDMFAEAAVDVIIGVDPAEWNIATAKRKLAGKVALWGGVNGHLTVEQATEAAVRQEVRTAMEVLAPGGGFILSPVDNVREDTSISRRNVAALIDEWRKVTGLK